MTLTVQTGRRQKVAAAAYRMRHYVLNMGEAQGQGYVGQALDAADMLACVYIDQLRYRADDDSGVDVPTRRAATFRSGDDALVEELTIFRSNEGAARAVIGR